MEHQQVRWCWFGVGAIVSVIVAICAIVIALVLVLVYNNCILLSYSYIWRSHPVPVVVEVSAILVH